MKAARLSVGILAAVAVALLPGAASAAPNPALRRPPPPIGLQTVDHPPADGINFFDNGPRTGSAIALTFDADMTQGMLQQLRSGAVPSWYNRAVVDLLRQEHVPATLFLTGLWAAAYPQEAKSLAADPLFEIGSHTYDHAAFRTPCYGLGRAPDRAAEITQAQGAITATAGIQPKLLRFPGDCYDRTDVALARELGLTVISGDVRAGDGFNFSAPSIAQTVVARIQPGSIVVLHLHGGRSAPMTAPALRLVIEAARARGFGFAKVGDLLGLNPPPPAKPDPREILQKLRRPDLRAPITLSGRPRREGPLLPPQRRVVRASAFCSLAMQVVCWVCDWATRCGRQATLSSLT
ncbi:MAG: polysaccharide deacetylase [Chloroflexi bacterium]|nr:MAG: polysaccharide deacetylase [Chloroflexota bacterium]